MIWPVIEKLISYVLIIAITYICSQTLIQINDNRRITAAKEELKAEFENERKDLQKQINRLEVMHNEANISTKQRLDVLQHEIEERK